MATLPQGLCGHRYRAIPAPLNLLLGFSKILITVACIENVHFFLRRHPDKHESRQRLLPLCRNLLCLARPWPGSLFCPTILADSSIREARKLVSGNEVRDRARLI